MVQEQTFMEQEAAAAAYVARFFAQQVNKQGKQTQAELVQFWMDVFETDKDKEEKVCTNKVLEAIKAQSFGKELSPDVSEAFTTAEQKFKKSGYTDRIIHH